MANKPYIDILLKLNTSLPTENNFVLGMIGFNYQYLMCANDKEYVKYHVDQCNSLIDDEASKIDYEYFRKSILRRNSMDLISNTRELVSLINKNLSN